MPKNNLYLIPEKIEKQKLVEEIKELTETPWWQEYQNQVDKSPLSPAARGKVVSKSGSEFVSERGKEGYGPMPVDRQALMIARSESIMSKIESDFPNVARLIKWNYDATLGFLRSKHAFSAYWGEKPFDVPCSHEDNYSKTGPAAWTEYHEKIREYVSQLCKRTAAIHDHYEKLGKARKGLVDYIWDEYYRILPYWPSVGGVNSRSFEANTNGAYENSDNYIVWSCLGRIYVKDERPGYEIFKASFWGSPEIKLLILDLYEMRRIEGSIENNPAEFENLKRHIKNKEDRYQGLIDWDRF